MSGSFVRSTLMKFDCFFSFSSIKQCKWSDLKNEKCSWTLCMSKWKKKNKNSTWRYNWIMFMCIEYVYFLSTMLYLSSRYYRWKRKQTGKHFGNVSASYIFLRVPGLPLLLDISEVKKQKFEQGHEWWGSSPKYTENGMWGGGIWGCDRYINHFTCIETQSLSAFY